jgi:hypothetical protein
MKVQNVCKARLICIHVLTLILMIAALGEMNAVVAETAQVTFYVH